MRRSHVTQKINLSQKFSLPHSSVNSADSAVRFSINQLKNMRLLDVRAIAQFYLTTKREYRRIKAYMQMLDYLRLLIIEYLQRNQHSQPESV